jgi:energy-coupling factor transporter ATP-binding protein EcfA2
MPSAVIVTPSPVEYQAVRQHLENLKEIVHPSGTIYEQGSCGSWQVAILEIFKEYDRASEEIERLISYCNSEMIIYVGRATVPRKSNFGDVLVATQIRYTDNSLLNQRLERLDKRLNISLQPSYDVLQRVRVEARKKDWLKNTSGGNAPNLLIGTILAFKKAISFDTLGLGISQILEEPLLIGSHDHVASLAVEVDGFGLWSLRKIKRNVPLLVVSGISALNGARQEEAAINASAFALHILSKLSTNYQSVTAPRQGNEFAISRIELCNIRCFESVTLDFHQHDRLQRWTMLLGDNAVGKSTLLKSLALGLCNESEAAALIQAMPGEILREGTTDGFITIHLMDESQTEQTKPYTITTTITKASPEAPETIRQTTEPADSFPWSDIFVCGYGTDRASQANTSYEQYQTIDAVRSLFDSQVFLQNPELIMLRQDPAVRACIANKLQKILMLDDTEGYLQNTKRGLELTGPWGRQPLPTLSDGYRSTTQWVLDFMSWLIHADRLVGNPDIGGILIINELEQHLHPRWQRIIVQRLRRQFPKTQIIASTHTPLVAAGIADVDDSMLIKLERDIEGSISLLEIDKAEINGKRADQILTSSAFDLMTTRNDRSHDEVDRYTALLGKTQRTTEEEVELALLRPRIQERYNSGENPMNQLVEKAIDVALADNLTSFSPEMLDTETRRQLLDLLQTDD